MEKSDIIKIKKPSLIDGKLRIDMIINNPIVFHKILYINNI